MNVVQRPGSAQVLDAQGRLVRSFETLREAQAFEQGYKSGVHEAVNVVRQTLTETLIIITEGEK